MFNSLKTKQANVFPNPILSGFTVQVDPELDILDMRCYNTDGLEIPYKKVGRNGLELLSDYKGLVLIYIKVENGDRYLSKLIIQ